MSTHHSLPWLQRKITPPLSTSSYTYLCNVSYKVISKTLVERLKHILSSIILENQGGFVQRRQIFNNFILVQEVILSRRSRGDKGMTINLDKDNAFERARHIFLCKFLDKLGFDNTFIQWVTPLYWLPLDFISCEWESH